MTLKILLTDTTRWPGSARLAIALRKTGFDVSAACLAHGHPLLKTNAVGRTFAYSGLRPLNSLIAAIEATDPELIVPCDDRAVQHLHELHAYARASGPSGNSIATLIERSLGLPRNFSIVSNRHDFMTISREEGLRVPATKVIETVDDLKSWHSEQALPWVLKADGTFGGRGIRIAQTPEEAERSFHELQGMFGVVQSLKQLIANRDPFCLRPCWEGHRPPVIVQSYVHGRPANCAVVCWEGKVLAGFGVDVVSAQGATEPATVVRAVESPEMMHAAERIAARLGLSGFFGLDFMVENETGAVHLIEMNPRSTPLCHLQLGKGRDMIGALWAQLSGDLAEETVAITENDMIAYFPDAWLHRSEFLSASFQDVPWEEPALIRELLLAPPKGGLLSWAFHRRS